MSKKGEIKLKKVLAGLPNYSKYCSKAKAYLQDNGIEVVENETGAPLSKEQLKQMIKDVDAAIAGVEVYDAEIMDAAPKLKVISRFGVGVDNFDLEEAKKRGIICTNCPGIKSRNKRRQLATINGYRIKWKNSGIIRIRCSCKKNSENFERFFLQDTCI